MTDCDRCRNMCCLTRDDWFPPSEIRYCLSQIVWYCKNAKEIRDGHWPPDPRQTAVGVKSPGVRVSKNTSKNIAIEIDIRLIWGWEYKNKNGMLIKHIRGPGMAGKLAEIQIRDGETIDTMDDEARRALFYSVSYDQRRLQSFSEWKADAHRRQSKNHKKYVYLSTSR